MSDTPTIQIETPKAKHKLVLKEWITGRDMRELKDIYLKVGKIDASGQGMTDINPDVLNQAENKSVELVVISVDEKTDGVLEAILNMPSEDTTFVLGKVAEIAGFSKKK